MKIIEIRLFEGRNVWSHSPVLQARLLLGPEERLTTREIPGFAERLLSLLPGLAEHTCSLGYPGGFCERLKSGTYLGHVVEHVALELQAAAGYPKNYGKTASGPFPGSWDVVIEYSTPELGKAALEAAVELVSAALAGRPFPVAEVISGLQAVGRETCLGPSTESIVAACRRRGIPVLPLPESGILQLGYGCRRKLVQATLTSETPCLAADLVSDKALTKRLLADAGLPVPPGRAVATLQEARRAALELGYPVAVKPRRGNQGKGVVLDVRGAAELAAAFRIAREYDSEVLVEKQVPGRHYRLLVIGGKLVAAAERLPALLIGDSIHTIRELVEIANSDPRRGEGHEKPLTRLRLDAVAVLELARQGYTPDSCPPAGHAVVLRSNANLSSGGTSRDVTDLVCPENAWIAEQAARLTGLDVAGVDLVTPDISRPAPGDGGAVIEVNAAPGFRMHLVPEEGEGRDVGAALVDHLFPPGSEASIPVISVTGTNGKTTTARLLAHFFRQQGLVVGLATTGGVYIGERCIFSGDTTGPKSARAVLRHPDVEVAVLETARGGILRGGLGYDKADVAVVTNIGPDHLGQDGVETLDDLFWVKSLVVEAVKESGYVVLNADDPYATRFASRAGGQVVYFTLHEDNLLVRRHLGAGGSAVFVRQGVVYAGSGCRAVRIISLKSIRAGMGGRAVFNLENALAATAAAFFLGVPVAVIRRVLRTFGCDSIHNPGRLNIWHLGRITVIVDYGHNAPAFRRVAEFARTLRPRRLLGVIGVPGDRGDEQIIAAGEAAASGFDELFIKEDSDLRGRAPGEVARLLCKGARRAGMPAPLLHVITEEVAAVKEALRRACHGDVVVVFYERLEPVMELLAAAEKELPAGGAAPAQALLHK